VLSSIKGFNKVSIKSISTYLYYRPLLLVYIDNYINTKLIYLEIRQELNI